MDAEDVNAARCPVCDDPVEQVRTLCSDACVREAVHQIDELSARRRQLGRQAVRDTKATSRWSRLFEPGEPVDREALEGLSERASTLMDALLRTGHGQDTREGAQTDPDITTP